MTAGKVNCRHNIPYKLHTKGLSKTKAVYLRKHDISITGS